MKKIILIIGVIFLFGITAETNFPKNTFHDTYTPVLKADVEKNNSLNNENVIYFRNNMIMNLSLPSENITPGDIPSLSKWELCKLPGAPQIPVRNYEILLPPNIDPQSIKIDIINDISVESNGEYNISPALFPVAYLKEEMAIDNSINFSNAYEENALWPAEFIQLSGKHQIRDASIVDIRFYPAQYNPITKKVMEHKNCLISISWDDITKKKPIDSLTLSFLSNFGENIDNFAEMLPYYVTSKASNDIPDTTYVIVTTNNIKLNSEKIDNFVRYKQASGFKVMVITEDDYGVDLGKQRVLNIRNWLQNHYVSDSIEYVLLIGDPDPDDETSSSDSVGDLPMLMCWPRHGATDSYEESPTDYFYADLTGNWDSDGDNYYGEHSEDTGVDFYPEVYVGRIPVYSSDYATLDNILQNTIDHHKNVGNEKQNFLLPMAISNYENEDGNGNNRTDGLSCPENVYNRILSSKGMNDTVLYERAGLDPVSTNAFHFDMPLSNANFITEFNKGNGAVFWWGHGNEDGVYRKYWESDDGDGIPESSEMAWVPFLKSSDMSSLETDQPAFIYQSSCQNGWPETSNNLGYALLKQGAAISTISASRVSWYITGNWNYDSYWSEYADNTNIGFHYFENLLKNEMSAGKALFTAKSLGGNGAYPGSWMNKMDFNLYGDPQLNYWGSNPPDIPNNPSPVNFAINVSLNPTLSVDVSDSDGDSMTVAFYNASDDSLIGYDVNVVNGGTASITWSGLETDSAYSWYVVLGDGQAVQNSSIWSFSTVSDTPVWNQIPTDQIVEYKQNFLYDVNASDQSGIDHYWINDTAHFYINENGVITNATVLLVGKINLEICAYDPYGLKTSVNISITVQDTLSPIWDQQPIDQIVEYGFNFIYDINASDQSGIELYWLNNTDNFNINHNGVITNGTILSLGKYFLIVWARDLYGNNCSSIIYIIVRDTIVPLISNPLDQIYTVSTTGHYINWSATDLNPDFYTIYQNGSEMVKNSWNSRNDIIFSIDGLVPGIYNYSIVIMDASGNMATDSVIVTVIDAVPEQKSIIIGFPMEYVIGSTMGGIVLIGISVLFGYKKRI